MTGCYGPRACVVSDWSPQVHVTMREGGNHVYIKGGEWWAFMVVVLISGLSKTFVSSSPCTDLRECHLATIQTPLWWHLSYPRYAVCDLTALIKAQAGASHTTELIFKTNVFALKINPLLTAFNSFTRWCKYSDKELGLELPQKRPITTGFLLYPCNMPSIG